jgi:V-type H+-transporting ATPase subunit E
MQLTPTQILLMLLSPGVTISHRPKDEDLVKKATDAALSRYKDVSGRESKVEFNADLPDDSAGGIVGSTMAGRIKVDNTLGERLKILEDKMLPELRHDLFGVNENRKFYTVSCVADARTRANANSDRVVLYVATDRGCTLFDSHVATFDY